MSATDNEVHNLRVKTYFPRVKDFERKENGDIIRDSLKGPEIIEARQQLSRERIVAGAEMKILQEQIRWCYHKEGVNHYENCKDLVQAYAERLKAPYHGAIRAPSKDHF